MTISISNTTKVHRLTMVVEPHFLVNFGISADQMKIKDRFLLAISRRFENKNFKASRIEGCKLVRQDDLGFDFYYGSCNTFQSPTELVLLCFDYDHPQTCFT